MPTIFRSGLGGRKEIRALVGIVLVGLVVLGLAWWLRLWVRQPPLPPHTAVRSAGELLALGEKARGADRMVPYNRGGLARVVDRAVGRNGDGAWEEVPANSILEVSETEIRGDEIWVHARAQGVGKSEYLRVHTSFLEPYRPVVLDKILEISGLRFVRLADDRVHALTVDGWLRNITAVPLSKCIVACVFRDKRDREVERKLTLIAELPPARLYRFQAAASGKPFASVSIEITHATPDGLRNYLSNLVINHSTE